ncbi:hypothetical protein KY289_016654 [Solanum tuberosum]|nr:hypothetical protein KY289_016654 [Solanum tuberosum]
MNKLELEDICELTGYEKGKRPFKYLGIHILAKRLSAIDCEALISKAKERGRAGIIEGITWNESAVAKMGGSKEHGNTLSRVAICGEGDMERNGHSGEGYGIPVVSLSINSYVG